PPPEDRPHHSLPMAGLCSHSPRCSPLLLRARRNCRYGRTEAQEGSSSSHHRQSEGCSLPQARLRVSLLPAASGEGSRCEGRGSIANRTLATLEQVVSEYIGVPSTTGRGAYLAGLAINEAVDYL